MNPRVIFFAAISLTAAACASTPQAPMHVYNSAFLENDGVVDATPRARSFDPLRVGDFPSDAAIYVVRNDGRWTGNPAASEPAAEIPTNVAVNEGTDSEPKRATSPEPEKTDVKTPSLSTTAPSRVGGTEVSKEASSVAPKDVDTQGYDPATAAQFVSSVYGMNGVDVPAAAPAAVYKACKTKGNVYFGTKPKVGDVVFFHNTFDANADGRNNDWYTHVGMVQSLDGSSTAEVISWFDGKVQVHKLNLERPEAAEVNGSTVNSRLREPGNDDAPFTQYYAGQLFAGFCGLLGEKDEFVLVENWQPGMTLGTK